MRKNDTQENGSISALVVSLYESDSPMSGMRDEEKKLMGYSPMRSTELDEVCIEKNEH